MKKKILLCLGVSAALSLSACAFAACSSEPDPLPEFNYDYSTPVEDFGDGIVIDGKPDEALWANRRALEADIKNTTASYKATAYFGEGGVYFAFWVQDDAVYYNAEREIWANSGVEFCVGSPENTSITYEIDLNAGGKRMLRKYTGAPYTNWFSDLHSAVWTDGEVNTTECKGYTAEIYLPYGLFNADGSDTPLDELLVNFAIIRASSSNASDTDRLWYSIGEQERGLGWAPASQNWYRFGADGLDANDVTLQAGEHGSLEGRNWSITGDTYEFTVLPEAGYCVDTLIVNGKDVADGIYYSGGAAKYSLTAQGDITVSATFAPLSSVTHTLNGSVQSEDGGALENLHLYAATGGALIDIAVQGGAYTADIPEAEYTLYCEASGYMTAIYDVDLYGNVTRNVTLRTKFLGSNVVIGAGSNESSWDLSMLGQGTAISNDAGWLVTANHTDMYGTKAFVSANIVLPMSPGAGRRAGFRFVDSSLNGVYVCLYANNENGSDTYEIQFIELGGGESTIWRYNYIFTDPAIRTLAESTGIPFAAMYENGKVSVWANGMQIVSDWSLSGNGITSVGDQTQIVPGLTTCGGYGVYYNIVFNTVGYENGYPVSVTTEGKGTVSADKDTYASGETVTFTITPQSGYEVTAVMINGKDYFASLANGQLALDTGTMTSVSIAVTFSRIAGEEGILSGTVTAEGGPVSGAQVVIYNAGGDRYETSTNEAGVYSFTRPVVGTWRMEITADGYNDYAQNVAVDGDTTHDVSLTALTMWEKYVLEGDGYNVDGIEEGTVVYTGTSGESHIKLSAAAGADEDFWFESVLRKQDTFIMDDAGGVRYGYTLYFGDQSVHTTIGRWTNDAANNWRFMMNNWGDIDATVPFSAAMNAAYESETGLRVAVARIDGTLCMFAEEDGIMKLVLSVRTDSTATAAVNLGFGTWFQTQNAEYKEVSWKIGSIALDIEQEATGGTVSVSGTYLGDNVIVTLTPEDGYELLSLTVNGELRTDECSKDQETGVYTLTLGNYKQTTSLTIVASFAQATEFDVTLTLQLHRYGVGENNLSAIGDGTEVTLSNVSQTYTAQAASGSVSFANVQTGTYQLIVEGYTAVTVEVLANVEKEITLEYAVIGSGNAIDTSQINDGQITVDFNTADEMVFFNQTVGADEDFYITAVFTNVDFDANDLRFGFFAGNDLDGDNYIDIWGTEAAVMHLVYQYFNSTREYVLQSPANWNGYFLDEAAATAMAGEEGLRIGLARVNGKFYFLMEENGVMKNVFTVSADLSAIADKELTVGLCVSKSQQAAGNAAVLKDVSIETVTAGTEFADPDIAALFKA